MLPGMPINGQNAQQTTITAERGSAGSYSLGDTSSTENSTFVLTRLTEAVAELTYGIAGMQATWSENRRERQERDRQEADIRRTNVEANASWQIPGQVDATDIVW